MRIAAALVLTTLVSTVVQSQPAAVHRSAAVRAAQSEDNWSMQRCLLGLTYGAPLKLAVGWGGGMVYESPDGGADICAFGAGKLGLGGARVSVGIARSVGAFGGGIGASAGVLRTFGAPYNAMPNRNYIGASLHVFPLLAIGGEIGWYTRIGSDTPGAPRRSMVAWSAGIGF